MLFIYDDNFLTEEEMQQIEKQVFNSNINWFYMALTQDGYHSHPGVIELPGIEDIPYFTHCPDEGPTYDIGLMLAKKFTEKHGIHYDRMGRIKYNLTPPVKRSYSLYPHTDTMDPHYVFLYYINTTDGDTVLYNETSDGHTKLTDATVMKKITPKRGAAFLVDGRHFHAIGTPCNGPMRGVINLNLMLNKWPE